MKPDGIEARRELLTQQGGLVELPADFDTHGMFGVLLELAEDLGFGSPPAVGLDGRQKSEPAGGPDTST